jgi:hypothetical protein
MASRLVGILSRLAFFACGTISILMSNVYRASQSVSYPAVTYRWTLFSAVLATVGGFAVCAALLPASWVEKACNSGPNSPRRRLVPIKMLASFAVFGYLSTIGLDLASTYWHPSPQFVFSMCLACVLSITVDVSNWTVWVLLAPLNGAVYGAFGAAFGFLFVALRNRI